MYNEYYGFSDKPFKLVPDPNLFYNSEVHRRALSYLKYGVESGEGFIVISGDIGTGKSTLVNQLISTIEPKNLQLINLVSTNVDSTELLALVAKKLNIEQVGKNKAELLYTIEKELLRSFETGKRTLLIVDEAQNLPPESIEELRMLSNFQVDGLPLLQSFLLGQNELRDHINGPEFEQFRQRIIASIILTPLADSETADYVKYRINSVSDKDELDLISEPALKLIHEFTAGIPRKINTLMDRVLLYGFISDLTVIEEQDVSLVLDEVRQEELAAEPKESGTKLSASSQTELANQELASLKEDIKFIKDSIEDLKDAVEYSITFKLKLSKLLDKSIKKKLDEI